jgi:type II secretory pathway pseudopilin PulG
MRLPGTAFRGWFASAGSAKRRSRGAALLLAMFLVAIIGIMLTVAGRAWHTEAQREKEAELLAVGGEYARAISRYHAASLQYPENLNQLLLDTRQQNTVRYLRRLYRDPMTGSKQWGLIKDASGRITGIYSLGKGVPLKQAGFEKILAKFNDAKSYADWTFIAEPGKAGPGGVPGAVPGAGPGPAPGAVPGPVGPGAQQPMTTAPSPIAQ